MPDLPELLSAEAARQQPSVAPPFAEIVQTARARRRRSQAVVAGCALGLAGIAGGALSLIHQPGPVPQPGPADSGGQTISLTGTMVMTGGPAGASPTPARGTVKVKTKHGTLTVTTNPDGTFTVRIPYGAYTVIGTSAAFDDGHQACRPVAPAVVNGNGSHHIKIVCSRR